MKTIRTYAKSMYMVTTAKGCTVSTHDGIQLIVAPVGQSVFYALSSEVVITNDDDAIVSQVDYKLALAFESKQLELRQEPARVARGRRPKKS